MGPEQGRERPRLKLAHSPIDFDGVQDFLNLIFTAQHGPPFEQCGDLILAEGIPLNRETAPDGANPVGLPQMGLGFRMVESLHPPDQPLDGGDPIENLTSNLKREFQCMIVSYDTIFVHRFKGFFEI